MFLYCRPMKTTLFLLATSILSSSASADGPARLDANRLAGGVSAGVVIDGQRGRTGDASVVVADRRTGGARIVPTRSRGDITVGRPTVAAPRPERRESGEPGFFSRTWDSVKKPGILIPGGMALALGAGGAMVAGPLGAITGAVIGALFGFIFAKALG